MLCAYVRHRHLNRLYSQKGKKKDVLIASSSEEQWRNMVAGLVLFNCFFKEARSDWIFHYLTLFENLFYEYTLIEFIPKTT